MKLLITFFVFILITTLYAEVNKTTEVNKITEVDKTAVAEEKQSFFDWEYLTDDWWGARSKLRDFGIDVRGSYVIGFSKNLRGGVDTAGESNKERLTFNVSFDTQKLFGWEGGTVFFQYQNHRGAFGTDEVGDLQQYDGLDDPEYDRVHMLWYQQLLFDHKIRIKIGKVEPKSEFFAPENATHHLGLSTERSPTIIAQGPAADSVNIFFDPNDWIHIGFGLYDGAFLEGRDENLMRVRSLFEPPADIVMFGEVHLRWNYGIGPGRILIGGWYINGKLSGFDGEIEDGTGSFYLVVDQILYIENPSIKDDKQGIGAYFQYGYADDNVSAFEHHFGFGLQWIGAIPTRDRDVWGAGVSHVNLSNEAGAGFDEDFETAFEIFYRAQLTPFLFSKVDLQYIANPGGVSGRDDALVFTIHATILF